MNIVIVNDFGHINGGTSHVAISSAINLAQKGYKVYYFCAVSPIEDRLLHEINITVICLYQKDILTNPNRFQAAIQGLWNYVSLQKLQELLRNLPQKETVIHIHGWTKALSHSVIFIAQIKKFPIVLTLHDYFIACPNGGFYNYPKKSVCPITALSVKCIFTNCDVRSYEQKIWRLLRSGIQKYILRIPQNIKNFIFLSHKSIQLLKPYLPLKASLFFIPSPIDTIRKDRITAEDNSYIYAISRLSPEKGLDLLAKVTHDIGADLVFIGEGNDKNNLTRINPGIIFEGWLTRQQMSDSLKHARFLVFPSKLYETQGLVVLEAASYGIPCIVSDITVASESILDGETGLLFKANDLDDLKVKILSLLNNDSLLEYLSKNSYRNFWLNQASTDEYMNKLISVYTKVISG